MVGEPIPPERLASAEQMADRTHVMRRAKARIDELEAELRECQATRDELVTTEMNEQQELAMARAARQEANKLVGELSQALRECQAARTKRFHALQQIAYPNNELGRLTASEAQDVARAALSAVGGTPGGAKGDG